MVSKWADRRWDYCLHSYIILVGSLGVASSMDSLLFCGFNKLQTWMSFGWAHQAASWMKSADQDRSGLLRTIFVRKVDLLSETQLWPQGLQILFLSPSLSPDTSCVKFITRNQLLTISACISRGSHQTSWKMMHIHSPPIFAIDFRCQEILKTLRLRRIHLQGFEWKRSRFKIRELQQFGFPRSIA